MIKTGIQTQYGVKWEPEYAERSKCGYWMGIDNYPDVPCKLIGRINWPQGDVDRVVALGADGADIVFYVARPIILANPKVFAWVVLNEASIWKTAVRAGYAAFNRRMTALMAGIGARHVCCNVNVGHPDNTYWNEGIKAIGEACQGAYALGLHGYSWPSLQTGYEDYVGRYKKIYAALRAAGYNPPPCLLTEIGLDKAILRDQPHAGYREVPGMTGAQWAEQVAWFEGQIAGDPDVLGALLFLSGAYEPWNIYGFEISRDDAMLIADKVSKVIPEEQSMNPIPDGAPFAVNDLRAELAWHPTKRWVTRSLDSIKRIIVHHTVTEVGATQTVRDHIKAINRGHIETNDWPRIGYHVLIGEKGVYWPVNELTDISYHAGTANSDSIGVAFIGDMTKHDPTQAQLDALRWLVQALGLPAIGHKEVAQTACPGNWWPEWKEWVNTPLTPPPVQEESVIVIDWEGNKRDLAYLKSQWGNVAWTESATWKTLVFYEDFSGSSTTMVHLEDADGEPLWGHVVTNSWPSGSVTATTNENGDTGFGWGSGSFYPHGETGPMSIEVDDMVVSGLGWLRLENGEYTNHYHLNLELWQGSAPVPPDGDIDRLIAEARAEIALALAKNQEEKALLESADAKLAQAQALR